MSIIDNIKRKMRMKSVLGTIFAVIVVLILIPILIAIALVVPFGVIYGINFLFKLGWSFIQMLVGAGVLLGVIALLRSLSGKK